MGAFINNLNIFIETNGIRQKYLSIRSGLSEDKVSKLLNGKIKVTESDMEALSYALGKNIDYFLTDSFGSFDKSKSGRLAFYAGEPDEEQISVANKLVEFVENLDEVLNSSSWYREAGSNLDEF